MTPLRFAIMGCGRIAKRHCEILSQADFSDLCAVCDVLPERATAYGAEYDVPSYEDVEQMLAAQKPDVLCILTPSGLHGRHIMQVAHQIQNIVVEKPMVLDLAEADRVIEHCEKLDNRLFVVMQNRFNRPVIKLREALEQGRFGDLLMGTVRVRWSRDQAYYDLDSWRGTWDLDGGVLGNQANHHVDLLEWMMGDADSVTGYAATQLVQVEVPTTVVAAIEFKNGALGVVEATTSSRPRDLEGSLSVMGSTGTVEIGGFAVNRIRHWHFDPARDEDQEVIGRYSENPPNVYGYGHAMYLRHVYNCLQNGEPRLVGPQEGRRCLEFIKAIYEAASSGKRVQVHG